MSRGVHSRHRLPRTLCSIIDSRTLAYLQRLSSMSSQQNEPSWEYTCTQDQGAVLTLQNAGVKRASITQQLFMRYAAKNYHSWLRCIADMPSGVRPVLVSGWVKTTPDWMAATFTSSRQRRTLTVDRASLTSVAAVEGPVLSRTGLYARTDRPLDSKADQCIFVTCCYVKFRLGKKLSSFFMRAGAGPQDPSNGRGEDSWPNAPMPSAEDDVESPEPEVCTFQQSIRL